VIGRGQQAAVTATCLVAAVTYAGAVTTRALIWFVLPGVVIAALVAWRLVARPAPWIALIVSAPLILGWSELVNIWSGTSNGPAARSTFVAAGCTLLAVVAASSPRPGLFLLPVTGVVFGALALGAGGEVRLVAVATVICAAGTLGWIEQSRHRWSTQPRQGVTLVVVSLVVGAAAAGAVVLQAQHDQRQSLLLARSQIDPAIKPAWPDPFANIVKTQPSRHARLAGPPLRTQRPRSSATRTTATRTTATGSHMWLIVVVALGGLMIALLIACIHRALAARLGWRRLRRRLASGTAAERVSGAWIWARLRLEACQLPLSSDVSPDVLAASAPTDDMPTGVLVHLRALAATTTTAAFMQNRAVSMAEAAAAWRMARRADLSARDSLTRLGRVGLALRRPEAQARR